MKILYISHTHPPKDKPLENLGGMQNVSMQLMKTVKDRGDVEIETILLQTTWRFIGFKTFFFLISLLWRVPSAIKKNRPDVVLFSSMVTASIIPFLSKKTPVPFVTINHGRDVTLPVAVYQKFLPIVFKKLQGVISVSSATRLACIERGMKPEKGVALPNGFESKSIESFPDKKKAQKIIEDTFEVDLKGLKLLLSVGRQVKRKGHQWFIENVMDKINSNVVLLLVGEGPETPRIREAKERYSRPERIILAGKQSQEILNAAYAASDLFVMPNIPVEGDMEGFGIVLLEANSAGVPAVASDLEGIKDVIKDGVNGHKTPALNAERFAEKIDDILSENLETISESSRTYVLEKFSWDFVISQYLNFLHEVRKRSSC